MFVGRQHTLPHSVSHLIISPAIVAQLSIRFAQYTYGIYLGFNGEPEQFPLIVQPTESLISPAIPHPFAAAPITAAAVLHSLHRLTSRIQCAKTCTRSIL